MKTFPRYLWLAALVSTASLSLPLPLFAGKPPKETAADYVAHEWGTFTSLQGADGVQFDWDPFGTADLPSFVFNTMNPARVPERPAFFNPGKWFKGGRQFLEGRFTSFYAKEKRRVIVELRVDDMMRSVSFVGPTEWYPNLPQVGKAMMRMPRYPQPHLVDRRWGDVELLPGVDESKLYPTDGTDSYYYAARETDAVPLQVASYDAAYHPIQLPEKFLFYRGISKFNAPLEVCQLDDFPGQTTLANHAKQPLKAVFIYALQGDRAKLVHLSDIPADDSAHWLNISSPDLPWRPVAEVRAEFTAKMRAALLSAGLYEKEAAAMVKMWGDSWFTEPGVRVLYTLPRTWADEVLPLKLTPAPKELSRVFVGRAELITPATEWAVMRELVHYAEGDDAARAAAAKAVRAIGLGRYTNSVIRHVARIGPKADALRKAAEGLVEASSPPAPKPAEATEP